MRWEKGTHRLMLNPLARPPRRSRYARQRGSLQFRGPALQLPAWFAQHPARYSVHAVVVALGLSAAVYASGVTNHHPVPARPAQAQAVVLQAAVAPRATVPAPQLMVADVAPPPVVASPEPVVEKAPTPQSYVVRAGDTIKSIASQFSLSPETIMWANSLEHPDLIEIGQSLVIPPVD